nr:hypothetical protein [Desulfobacterales bacterium]
MFKKQTNLIFFLIGIFLLSGCAGLEMAERTKAEFSTYHDAAYVAAEDDVLLLSDTSAADAVKGIYLKDLPSAREGIVVAASNAHDRIKKQADYICDGTADQVEINAAILEAV